MDEQERRAAAYPELVELLAMGSREHQYGLLERSTGWTVGHLPHCHACRVTELMKRLGEE
jgi:hypothetical protein